MPHRRRKKFRCISTLAASPAAWQQSAKPDSSVSSCFAEGGGGVGVGVRWYEVLGRSGQRTVKVDASEGTTSMLGSRTQASRGGMSRVDGAHNQLLPRRRRSPERGGPDLGERVR